MSTFSAELVDKNPRGSTLPSPFSEKVNSTATVFFNHHGAETKESGTKSILEKEEGLCPS